MATIDRTKLLKDLSMNVIEVSFVKVDGSHRTMRCTLMPHYMPEGTDMRHLKEMHLKPENTETCVVWEINDRKWKSFHVDSVVYATILSAS